MKEFKGTCGEWKVEENSNYKTLHEIWSYNNEGFPTYIARMCFAPHSLANAKLIANAPKMLELLQKCDNWIANCNENMSIVKEIEQLLNKISNY